MGTVNINKLKGRMVENEITMEGLANALGVNRATLYRKFENGGEGLSVLDANRIVETLKLTNEDAVAIFFGTQVA